MSDTPTDFLSYADWLGLNQDEIQQAQEQMFQEAEAAAGRAGELSRGIGQQLRDNAALGGSMQPAQAVSYGEFMEQQRRAKNALGGLNADGEMSPQERAARRALGPVDAGRQVRVARQLDEQDSFIGDRLKQGQHAAKTQRVMWDQQAASEKWKQGLGARIDADWAERRRKTAEFARSDGRMTSDEKARLQRQQLTPEQAARLREDIQRAYGQSAQGPSPTGGVNEGSGYAEKDPYRRQKWTGDIENEPLW